MPVSPLVLVALTLVLVAGVFALHAWAWPAVARRVRRRRLESASPRALAAEAADIAAWAGLGDRPEVARLVEGPWEPAAVAEALDALLDAAGTLDEQAGTTGRDGRTFALLDGGLAEIREVLAHRAGG